MIGPPRLFASRLLLGAVIFVIGLASSGHAASGSIPARIVSLAPSITETVFALGFGNRLVGVTNHCDYPDEAKRLPKIGDFMSPSLEVIAAKHPDLVIGVIGATDPARAQEIERLGIKIALVSVTSITEILNSFRRIATLLSLRCPQAEFNRPLLRRCPPRLAFSQSIFRP